MPTTSSTRDTTPARCWALLAATLLLVWAGSIYTPWAPHTAPRLWLYDVVYYLRFVVGAWAIAEALRLALRRRVRSAAWIPLALAALAALLGWADARTGAALDLRLRASADALERHAASGPAPGRGRVGHFIIDGVSRPCSPSEPWLWVGRPHGGGTGTSLALVRGGAGLPAAPAGDAFRFRAAGDGWWVAYQHAGRHVRATALAPDLRGACTPGRGLSSHRQGRAFIDAGWRDPALASRP